MGRIEALGDSPVTEEAFPGGGQEKVVSQEELKRRVEKMIRKIGRVWKYDRERGIEEAKNIRDNLPEETAKWLKGRLPVFLADGPLPEDNKKVVFEQKPAGEEEKKRLSTGTRKHVRQQIAVAKKSGQDYSWIRSSYNKKS